MLVVAADVRRQRFVREELEDAGYEVEIASSVDAALACLAVMRPSLIVADDQLAGVDRLKLAVKVGASEPTAAIPMLTVAGALTRC